MHNYKIKLSYDGGRYKGWQRLKTASLTVQGTLEEHLSSLFDEAIEINGSGRTDAGVHAYEQVASFSTKNYHSPEDVMKYMNHHLSSDLSILSVEESNPRFHARYNAKGKVYVYRIYNHKIMDPFRRKYCYHIMKSLDLKKMKEAASFLVGEKDFKSFTTMKSKKKSTVRQLEFIDFSHVDGELHITFKGNGFLHNMIRILVGTLIEVGLGKLSPHDIPEILDKKERQYAGETAPPHGLFLKKVLY